MANGLPDFFYCKLCGYKTVRYIASEMICSSCYRFWSVTRQYIKDNRSVIPADRLILLTRFLMGSFDPRTGEPNGKSVSQAWKADHPEAWPKEWETRKSMGSGNS